MGSKEVQRWADSAMYSAEPVEAEAGPRVYLLSATADPLGTVAASAALYEGRVVRSLAEVTDEERRYYLEQIQKTKIKAPLEFVQFHFLIEGVTRGFTHQMVRQRTATYVQESTRFAVKEDVPVGLPPSLAGTDSHKDERVRSPQDGMRMLWDDALGAVAQVYSRLIEAGMPAEDARGLLPTNLLTRIHYRVDLRNLLNVVGDRLCTQAQFEWRLVLARMAEAIRRYAGEPTTGRYYNCPDTSPTGGTYRAARHAGWQFAAIADLFRPVCYQVGTCVFQAGFDRKCSIRDRVLAFASRNVPSEKWGEEYVGTNRTLFDVPPLPWAETVTKREVIPPIQPAEWLADPGAAR